MFQHACAVLVSHSSVYAFPAPVDPLDGPVCLFLDARHCGDGVEQAVLLCWVLDVGLKQQAVHLCRRGDTRRMYAHTYTRLLGRDHAQCASWQKKRKWQEGPPRASLAPA